MNIGQEEGESSKSDSLPKPSPKCALGVENQYQHNFFLDNISTFHKQYIKVCPNGRSFRCLRCQVFLDIATLEQHLEGKQHNRSRSERLRDKFLPKPEYVKTFGQHPMCYKQYLKAKHMLETTAIVIEDLPDSLSRTEIEQYFKNFGRIKECHYSVTNNRCALIQFRYPESLIELRKRRIKIQGMMLEASTFKEIALQNELNFIRMNNTIKRSQDFQTQLNILLEELQPEWLNGKYVQLCSDLKDTLKGNFPGCVLFPFGASSTGLGFTTSPVNVHVEYKEEIGTSTYILENKEKEFIKQIKNMIEEYNLVFLHAPLDKKVDKRDRDIDVKCVHNATQLNCNIYFTQAESVRTSSLIRCYLSMTDKLKPLIMIIKYWGKVHQLIEPPFSSYALTLLLIFYLQQTPYYLPPVEVLQSFEGPLSADFVLSEKFDSESLNQSSIPEILQGFFDYYTNFDYLLYIICPYLGKLILKAEFFANSNFDQNNEPINDFLVKTITGENKFSRTKMSTIFLQNPLERDYNVTRMVPESLLNRFIGLCEVSARICKHHNDFNLYKLFTCREPKDQKTLNYYSFSNTFHFQMTMNENRIQFINSEIEKMNILDPEEKSIQTKMIWYNLVKKFLISILTLMKYEINIEDDKHPTIKSQRLNEQVDVHDEHTIDSVTLHCSKVGFCCLRKLIRNGVTLEGIDLDDQRTLMQLIYEKIIVLNTTNSLTLNIQTKYNPTQVVILLTPIKFRKGFRYFSRHLSELFPKWFEKYISELDAQSLTQKYFNTTKQEEELNEIKFDPNDKSVKCVQIETLQESECQRVVETKDDHDNVQTEISNLVQVKLEPTEAELENCDTVATQELDLSNNQAELEKVAEFNCEPEHDETFKLLHN